MRVVDHHAALELICRAERCWGIFLSFGWWSAEASGSDPGAWLDQLHAAAPVLNSQECAQISIDGEGYLLFDTEAAMLEVFNSIVGNNGPTETNAYHGPCRVYALAAGPDGRLLCENT